MTFAKLSAACKNTIGAFSEAPQDKGSVNTTGTHHPDRPEIRGILET